jgi:transposase-like protein
MLRKRWAEPADLNLCIQRRRDKRAALRLVRKLLRRQGFAPKLLTTDKLGSNGSAFRHLCLTCPHEQDCGRTIAPRIPTKSCGDESQPT